MRPDRADTPVWPDEAVHAAVDDGVVRAATPSIAIGLRDVSLQFGNSPASDTSRVLDHISADIKENEIVALVGPSGCGKSTLLNLVAGLLTPTDGQVLTFGEPVDGPNTGVGYVTQRDTLLPWRTVERNLSVPLEIRKVDKRARHEKIRTELERVGLEDFAKHYPAQLSGGMRSRANLARTLIYEPDIVLMDEPFAALDALMRHRLQQELLSIWSGRPVTILYVTHDIDEAIVLASRILVMTRGPGRIKAEFEVPYSYPRDIAAIRTDSGLPEIRARVWKALEFEVRPKSSAGES